MSGNDQFKPITVNADGLTALLAVMTIEIVRALKPTTEVDQALTELGSRFLDISAKMNNPDDAALVRLLAEKLISTENSGL